MPHPLGGGPRGYPPVLLRVVTQSPEGGGICCVVARSFPASGCGDGGRFCDANRSITRTPPERRRNWTAMPAWASGRIALWSCAERARGVRERGRRRSSSVAVPLQCGVRSRSPRTASTKGWAGCGASKASRISREVQFRAGAAARAQARVTAWRVPDELASGRQARAWLTAVQRAPRILGKACPMTLELVFGAAGGIGEGREGDG